MKVLSLTTTLLAAMSLTVLAESYTIKAGDTVSSISRKHKVSVAKIMKLNRISDPTKLRIGQSIKVSTSSSAPKTSSKSKTSSVSKSGNYKVATGDTFYSIARRHDMSVSLLRKLNPSVSAQRISPGQSIAVSGTPKKAVRKTTSVAKVPKKTIRKAKVETAPVVEKEVFVATKIELPAPAPVALEPQPILTATTLATNTVDPAPIQEAVAAVSQTESIPISTPPAPPVVEQSYQAAPSSVASVILTDETTFDAFASKHGTDTTQLNALNGWNLPKATVLARGSEIYVPQ